jgi:hypothetical protein
MRGLSKVTSENRDHFLRATRLWFGLWLVAWLGWGAIVSLVGIFAMAGSNPAFGIILIVAALIGIISSLIGIIFPKKSKWWAGGIVLGILLSVVASIQDSFYWREENKKTCEWIIRDRYCKPSTIDSMECGSLGGGSAILPFSACDDFPDLKKQLKEKLAALKEGFAWRGADIPAFNTVIIRTMTAIGDDIYSNPYLNVSPDPRIEALRLAKSCIHEVDPFGILSELGIAHITLGGKHEVHPDQYDIYRNFRKRHSGEFDYLPEKEGSRFLPTGTVKKRNSRVSLYRSL